MIFIIVQNRNMELFQLVNENENENENESENENKKRT